MWGGAGWEKVWKRLGSVLVKIVGGEKGSGPKFSLGLVWDTCVRVERVMPGVKPSGILVGMKSHGRGLEAKVELN